MEIKEKNKTITCRSCKVSFEPLYHNGIIKSRYCIKCLVKKGKQKQWKEKKKELKEKLKTHSDWLNEFQEVFNKYIRLRDKGKPCISCGKPYGTFTESAGHYFSVGSSPSLRFNEDNVHLQCWFNCNKNKHGNIAEYTPHLIEKIGKERYDRLLRLRNDTLKLTIPEIQEKIKEYRLKIKQLESC